MRRTLIVAALAMLALAAPAVAADPSGTTPTAADLARDACKIEKHGVSTKVFKLTYAAKSTSKAMAACVAKAAPVAATELKNAAKTCKAERDADAAAFAEKYGTNENNKNAFGKCVSAAAKADEQA